ncbi:MAG: transcriptional repressor LexA [Parvibaculales bacterium]
MLTKKQFELLLFINERLKETGISPSFDEMKEALNLRSKSGIHRLITALEERGFIKRLPHRARALEIVKLPDTMASSLAAPLRTTKSTNLNTTRPNQNIATPSNNNQAASDDKAISLSVMGRIAAGTPIEALQEEVNQVSVPVEMLRSGEHYALEVHGDSMIEAGIFDGDTAIIQSGATAENGEIVVALVEGHEATLKRLRRKGEMIALEASNPAHETRIFRADQVRVQGRLVGLIRKY